MQLVYYRDVPNFGDALNPVLAERVFGDVFASNSSNHVLFIGTIVGKSAPVGCHEIIIGAGAGYKRGGYDTRNRTVMCVRGPHTCDLLGIDRSYAAIDPAILVSRYFPQSTSGGMAFMPHHHTHTAAGDALVSVCAGIGVTYISPLDDIHAVMAQIAGASGLITEALHGAIVAEAYGVPWVPVIYSSKVLEKKWHDFTATIGSEYRPIDISANIAFDDVVRPTNVVKFGLAKIGLGKAKYKYLPIKKVSRSAIRGLEEDLRKLKSGSFVKSDHVIKARSISQLDSAISRFQEFYL